MADSSYTVGIKIVSKNGYHTPAEARAYYKKYARDGITWHWWNTPNAVADTHAAHNNIVNYITGKASRGEGSVNYVASRFALDLLVNPDNVAWASQSGNPTTISVECSPHPSDAAYKLYGWLADQLEQRYGKTLKFYKHSDWFSTACPGTLDLSSIRQEADKWKRGEYDKPVTPPKPVEPPKPTVPEMVYTAYPSGELKKYRFNKDTHLYTVDKNTWGEITSGKAFKKGEEIDIAGAVLNKALNATYLLTKYSLDRKTPTGFSQADLDRVEPPIVVPEPPKPTPETTEPTDYDKAQDERLSAIEKVLKSITDFLSGIFSGFKKG